MASEYRSTSKSAISIVFVLLLAGTATAVAFSPGPQAQATPANQTSATTVSVSATGEVQAAPDVAILHLESAAEAEDPQTASERLARNVSQLRTALQEANVSEDQIRTTEFNIFDVSERERPARDQDNVTRYRAQQAFAVEIQNTSRAGELIDVAVANGASSIRGVEFTLSDETQATLRDQALETAMDSARSQAETLAATEDLRIVGVRSMATDSDGPRPLVAREAAADAGSGTQIDSGPVTVRATVDVTYNATG